MQDPVEPEDGEKITMMSRFPMLIVRALGAMELEDEGNINVLEDWDDHQVLMMGGLRVIWSEIKVMRLSIDQPLMWRIIYPRMVSFFGSRLCRDQVQLLNDLRTIAGIPPSGEPDDFPN